MEFFHHYLTQPILMHAERILHGINTLSCALKDALTITCDAQLRAITEVRELFQICADPSQLTTVPLQPKPKIRDRRKRRKACIPLTPNTCIPLTPPPPRVHKPTKATQSPRVHFPAVAVPNPRVATSAPRVETSQPQKSDMPEPIAWLTYSHQPRPIPMPTEPVPQFTRSHTDNLVSLAQTSGQRYPRKFILDWQMPVIDEETGQSL